eukprot:PhM_4_TR2470/c1_g3_i10/m.62053
MQWNANGLSAAKAAILATYAAECDVVLVQETKCKAEHVNVPGFDCFHARAPRHAGAFLSRGGAAIFIRRNLADWHVGLPTLLSTDASQAVSITMTHSDALDDDGELTTVHVTSLYTRPAVPLHNADLPRIPAGDEHVVVAGDVNAHCQWWDNLIPEDARGGFIANWLLNNHMAVLNDPDVPTRTRPTVHHQRASAPDISAVKNMVSLGWNARAVPDSDHSLISFTVGVGDITEQATNRISRRPMWSLARANWPAFMRSVEQTLSVRVPRDVERANTQLTDAITSAATRHIPRGALGVAHPIHRIMREAPIVAATAAIAGLEGAAATAALRQRRELIDKRLREEFERKATELDPSDSSTWRFIRSLGQTPVVDTAAVNDGRGGVTQTDRQKARALAQHYASVCRHGRTPRPMRARARRQVLAHPVTPTEFAAAMRTVKKKKAPGADGVLPEFILHLGPLAQRWLHHIVSSSVFTGRVPRAWKCGVIVPLAKTGKPMNELSSYRPVTLTSVIAKLAERVIAHRLTFETWDKLNTNQYGYAKGKSAADAVAVLSETILRGFNFSTNRGRLRNDGRLRHHIARDRAGAVLFDFTSAFDRVGRRRGSSWTVGL